MSHVATHTLKQRLLAGVAALAVLTGVMGAGIVASGAADAQTPTPGTATVTPVQGTPVTPPATGTGLAGTGGGSDYSVPIVLLALVALGGGAAFAYASRRNS